MPFPEYWQERPCGIETDMTLRDYFAAHAMQAMVCGGLNSSEIAKAAYRLADAMLAERESPQEEKA